MRTQQSSKPSTFQTQCSCWWRTRRSRVSVLRAFVARVTRVPTTITTRTEGDPPRSGNTGNTWHVHFYLDSTWLSCDRNSQFWLVAPGPSWLLIGYDIELVLSAGCAVQYFVILSTHPHETKSQCYCHIYGCDDWWRGIHFADYIKLFSHR